MNSQYYKVLKAPQMGRPVKTTCAGDDGGVKTRYTGCENMFRAPRPRSGIVVVALLSNSTKDVKEKLNVPAILQ